jgi:hypothetical protein
LPPSSRIRLPRSVSDRSHLSGDMVLAHKKTGRKIRPASHRGVRISDGGDANGDGGGDDGADGGAAASGDDEGDNGGGADARAAVRCARSARPSDDRSRRGGRPAGPARRQVKTERNRPGRSGPEVALPVHRWSQVSRRPVPEPWRLQAQDVEFSCCPTFSKVFDPQASGKSDQNSPGPANGTVRECKVLQPTQICVDGSIPATHATLGGHHEPALNLAGTSFICRTGGRYGSRQVNGVAANHGLFEGVTSANPCKWAKL